MLIMLAVLVFVFMSVSVYLSYSQILHAQRLNTDYGKLQAIYAAEAGIFAALDARRDLVAATLYKNAAGEATYTATRSATSEPYWITSTAQVSVKGSALTATVKGYVVGRQVVMWEF